MQFPICFARSPRHRLWWRRLIVSGASLSAAFLTCWYLIPFAVPIPADVLAGPDASTLIVDRHGAPIHHRPRQDYYRHRSLSQFPPALIHATLAAEDKRFFDHQGIDLRANLRAVKDAIMLGRFVSGASTITQQTIKLATHSPRRSFSNKVHEAFMARHLEMVSSKSEILNAYFNRLDYGNRTQGPAQAALHYFGKELSDLSLAETALLAGLPQAPSRLNPYRNLDMALKRRDWILDRMQQVYQYPAREIARAKAEPIQLHKQWSEDSDQHLASLAMQHRTPGSSVVHSFLDKNLQTKVRKIIRAELKNLREKHVQHGAAVVIDHLNGEVISLVGSVDFNDDVGSQINAALVPRSPGSALKPFTYLLAIDKLGLNPASILPDIPTSYPGNLGAEAFVNYDRSFRGPVTMQRALGNSLNIPVVRVLNSLGGAEPLLKSLRQLGFRHLSQPASSYGLSLTIGSGEVSLLEITNAYASLARLGNHQPARIFASQPSQPSIRCFSEESSYLITSILRDNAARFHSFGSHSALRFPFPCAVKTGTSSDFRDNFCVGFTDRYTVGVWVGNLDNSPMKGVSGVTGAGPIFHQIMLSLHADRLPRQLPPPKGITLVKIDPHTGKQLLRSHPRYYLAESCYLPEDRLPPFASASDYDSEGKVRLDGLYYPWLRDTPSPHFIAAAELDAPHPLRVLSPTHDATYLLDPDLPGQGAFLPLISNLPQQTQWHCESLQFVTERNQPTLHLIEGTHEITATCARTGQKQVIKFHVKSL